jgi:hypothetical protein
MLGSIPGRDNNYPNALVHFTHVMGYHFKLGHQLSSIALEIRNSLSLNVLRCTAHVSYSVSEHTTN